MYRELTRQERGDIRVLVTRRCANFDREYGCLPLECECYMLGKCWTGAYCRYFREAVLPNEPGLEAALVYPGGDPALRVCPICERSFYPHGKAAYCSARCSAVARRRRQREYMRKRRAGS